MGCVALFAVCVVLAVMWRRRRRPLPIVRRKRGPAPGGAKPHVEKDIIVGSNPLAGSRVRSSEEGSEATAIALPFALSGAVPTESLAMGAQYSQVQLGGMGTAEAGAAMVLSASAARRGSQHLPEFLTVQRTHGTQGLRQASTRLSIQKAQADLMQTMQWATSNRVRDYINPDLEPALGGQPGEGGETASAARRLKLRRDFAGSKIRPQRSSRKARFSLRKADQRGSGAVAAGSAVSKRLSVYRSSARHGHRGVVKRVPLPKARTGPRTRPTG